ncbi:hypothetical protein LSUB1_G001835 [Lachnellula subtilissima]|uniref:Uncharacterized protein n=1 Tax=Lachnellula subtilissima TaxID=602034 RepID=A0A8H8S127_9HELO|nr:hypothetical protein LSUB1_G001835 [Lachnellula subtilissima]
MASRSFKPASYLASAAQQTPSRSPRPSFARTSSASSNVSSKSDDSFGTSLRPMNTGSTGEGNTAPVKENISRSGGPSSPCIVALGSPVSRPQKFEDTSTPSRQRSKPIAIELPPRNVPSTYTPLTGRGDHRKSYFPDHDDFSKTYKEHHYGFSRSSTPGSPSNMSASSSVMSSPGSEITPRAATSVPFDLIQPTASATIDSLGIPAGKYYPSNYKSPATTRVSTPTSAAAPLPPTDLTLPSDTAKKSKRQKSSGHERNSSDVKRKLQQYQRDMIAQARQAKSRTGGKGLGFHIQMPKPVSPKLMPAGSPGPITPFELEECDEYLTSVTRGRGDTSIGGGFQQDENLINQMISQEISRAAEIGHPRSLN